MVAQEGQMGRQFFVSKHGKGQIRGANVCLQKLKGTNWETNVCLPKLKGTLKGTNWGTKFVPNSEKRQICLQRQVGGH